MMANTEWTQRAGMNSVSDTVTVATYVDQAEDARDAAQGFEAGAEDAADRAEAAAASVSLEVADYAALDALTDGVDVGESVRVQGIDQLYTRVNSGGDTNTTGGLSFNKIDREVSLSSPAYTSLLGDLLSGNPVSVMAAIPRANHEAILAGTSTYDVSTDVNDLLGNMPDYGGVYFPRGKYLTGNIKIDGKSGFKVFGQGATLQLTGDGSAYGGLGVEVAGTTSDLEIFGLSILGDGDKANKHKGVYSLSGHDFADLNIHDLNIQDVINGVSVNANLGGSIDGFTVNNIQLRDILGVSSGEGYGVHVAYQNAGSARGIISNIRSVNTGRHAIYIARASNVDVSNIQSFGHRANITAAEIADGTDGRGKVRSAVLIARSSHITASNIRVAGGYDGAIQVASNPDAEVGVSTYDVRLSNLNLFDQQDNIPLLFMGDPSPSIAGYPEDVVVSGVKCYTDFTGRSGSNGVDAIRHNCGKNVTYRDIDVTIKGTTGTRSAMELRNHGESGQSTDYNADVLVDGLTAYVEGAGSQRGVYLHTTTVDDSGAKVILRNVEARGDIADEGVTFANDPAANTNIRFHKSNGQVVGSYTDGDTTPDVSGGVTFLRIANTSPTTITGLDGGVDGQRVTLLFDDGNTTLDYSSTFRPDGDQPQTSRSRLCVTAVLDGGAWYFDSDPRDDVVANTELADITSAVNTAGKFAGKTVSVNTGGAYSRWVAVASSAGAAWYLADGSSSVTPS